MSFRLALLAVPLTAAFAVARADDAYTAFPDLVPPKTDDDRWQITEVAPRITGGSRQPIDPNESTRRQIRKAQLNELAVFTLKTSEVLRLGFRNPDTYYRVAFGILAAGEAGAELEATATARVPWFEERVLALKLIEQLLAERVRTNNVSSFALNEIRYRRLGAELDLLRAAELAKQDGLPQPAVPEPVFLRESPRFTGYPQFQASDLGSTNLDSPLDPVDFPRTLGRRPFELLPADPPCVRTLKAAVNQGVADVRRFGVVFRRGAFGREAAAVWMVLVNDLAALGGRLEPDPRERAAWCVEWVRIAKTIERLTEARAASGTDAPQELNYARALRLDAELKLLAAAGPPVRTWPPPGKPASPGAFTALPELRPSPLARRVQEHHRAGLLVPIPKDAPVSEQLTIARFNEAHDYHERTTPPHPTDRYDRELRGPSRPAMLAATPLIDLEDTSDGRAWWLGERVTRLNREEAALEKWDQPDKDRLQAPYVIHFHRLKAEAELLEFKAEVEKAGKR
jgi:hypothetical protein